MDSRRPSHRPVQCMWRYGLGLLMIWGIAACGATEQGSAAPMPIAEPTAAGSAPAPTPIADSTAASPPPTPSPSVEVRSAGGLTAIAIARPNIDLEPLLVQPGDLPAGIADAHADDPAPANFEDDPPAASIIGRRFERDGRGAGRVSLLLYGSQADLEPAYQRLAASVLDEAGLAGTTGFPKPDVGDKVVAARLAFASSTYGTGRVTVVVFARCRALVDIWLNEWAGITTDAALAYAKRLDQRLAKVVCDSS